MGGSDFDEERLPVSKKIVKKIFGCIAPVAPSGFQITTSKKTSSLLKDKKDEPAQGRDASRTRTRKMKRPILKIAQKQT